MKKTTFFFLLKSIFLLVIGQVSAQPLDYAFYKMFPNDYSSQLGEAKELIASIDRQSKDFEAEIEAFFKFNDALLAEGQKDNNTDKIFIYYHNQIDFYNALQESEKAYEIAEKGRDLGRKEKNEAMELSFLRRQGIIFTHQGATNIALDSFWVGLNRSIDAKLLGTEALFQQHIAFSFYELDENKKLTPKIEELLKKTISLFEQLEYPLGVMGTRFNLALLQERYSNAIPIMKEFIVKNRENGLIYCPADLQIELADALNKNGQKQEAKAIYLEMIDSLEINESFKTPYFTCLKNMQNITEEENMSVSFKYAQQLYDTAKERKVFRFEAIGAEILTNHYEELQDFEKALYYSKQKEIAENHAFGSRKEVHHKVFDYFFKIKEEELQNEILQKDMFISQRNSQLYLLLIGLLGILVLCALWVIKMRRRHDVIQIKKNEKIEEQLQQITQQSEDLKKANTQILEQNVLLESQISQKMLFLAHKNDLIEQLQSTAEWIGDASLRKEFLSLLRQNQTEDNWKELSIQLQKSQQPFFNCLSQRFPNLSAQELSLCAFLKMNMSTKDIAALTFRKAESIKVARSRLRKKLDLTGKNIDLVTFLNGIY